jgi:spoIIIJ-associated protein
VSENETGAVSVELSEEAETALRSLIDATLLGLDVDGEITVDVDDEGEVTARVVTEEADPVVGRGGATVNALQYLVSQVVYRASSGERRRVAVDVNDYRARRVAALESLAERAAQEAVEYEEEIELDAMNPAERRIVHMALRDNATVVTRSEGDEPRRRIIVEPAPDTP